MTEQNQIAQEEISFLRPIKTKAEPVLWGATATLFCIYVGLVAFKALTISEAPLTALLGRLLGSIAVPFGFLRLCARSKLVKNQRQKVSIFASTCLALIALNATSALAALQYIKLSH